MKKWYGNSFRLGMIGGGQLGRMLIQSAINYNLNISVLDGDKNAPVKVFPILLTEVLPILILFTSSEKTKKLLR